MEKARTQVQYPLTTPRLSMDGIKYAIKKTICNSCAVWIEKKINVKIKHPRIVGQARFDLKEPRHHNGGMGPILTLED
jgi:hypothetical protein